jgi:non-ribosomal peptide synthetase component F
MRRIQISGLIAAAVLVASTANAQYRQDDPYRDGRGAYRQDGTGLIRSVQSDLSRAASRGYMSGRERSRLDQALRNLADFDRDLSRGRFDRHDLDRAIDHVNDVVKSNRIDPREREILYADLNRLRDFRASGGFSGGRSDDGYGYRR